MSLTQKKVVRGLLLFFGWTAVTFAVVVAVTSAPLLLEGFFPADGNGSLGHVGMIIGGIIGSFLTLISGGVGTLMLWKARKMARAGIALPDHAASAC